MGSEMCIRDRLHCDVMLRCCHAWPRIVMFRRARWSVEHTQSPAVFASAPAVALPPSAIGKLPTCCKLRVASCKSVRAVRFISGRISRNLNTDTENRDHDTLCSWFLSFSGFGTAQTCMSVPKLVIRHVVRQDLYLHRTPLYRLTVTLAL